MGKYNSVLMARYIVAISNSRKVAINMTKLQKLLFIAYGLYLAVSNARLVNEHPQAWPYGPVFPSTRNKLLKVNMASIVLTSEEFSELGGDGELQDLLELVFKSFGDWSAMRLTRWSHMEGSAWEQTVLREGFKWGDRIEDADIQDYFQSIISENRPTMES